MNPRAAPASRAWCLFFSCTLLAGPFLVARAPAAEAPEEAREIEFRINGEAVSKASIAEGLKAAERAAPKVCPTGRMEGWRLRRARLIRLIPLRQFLKSERIEITAEEIDKRIEELKAQPNPFGRHPPKPLTHVMVRECISPGDLRLMVLVNAGMARWAEAQWKKKWPDAETWSDHCRAERPNLIREFGKFRWMSFSMSRWPKGAKDEGEALAML